MTPILTTSRMQQCVASKGRLISLPPLPIPNFFLVPTLLFASLSSSFSWCTWTQGSGHSGHQLQFRSCQCSSVPDFFPLPKPSAPFPPALYFPATSKLASKRPQELWGYFPSPCVSQRATNASSRISHQRSSCSASAQRSAWHRAASPSLPRTCTRG